MRHEKTTCFLPCRKGSQRVPNKNIRPFCGYQFGLIEIKLKQLLEADAIDSIVLSTNDESILEYASSLGNCKIKLHKRQEHLSTSETSTDQLVAHALELIDEGNILWTHVTSPFLNAFHYNEIVKLYSEKVLEGYDSLMTTNLIHGFLWQNGDAMNYDRQVEKWPRTQTLTPVHEVNSGAFLAHTKIYSELDDRIGRRPYLYSLDKLISHDIDWPDDFTIAECLLEKGLVSL
ncbi:acylneuraminate cytidylyltransferase family protein [Pseudomonas sp. SGAir0191]|uniref:acylneuraminate cytidylyltransferase family protein n=1 Tax=Pseudomonas sp. SGAir0191 TaxID=2217867 RepID=UPI000C2B8CF7|nr:acylneuraminate cytidylyltransferase family protein [Pseudomonas sp. SGAir0191]AUA32245.1 acylneuraminate cytidylyltransferase family protein [Pseudomonas sp. SGAir0191]